MLGKSSLVMAGLDPVISSCTAVSCNMVPRQMAGSGPAMTVGAAFSRVDSQP
jgi:hypothetical protein